ncbi:hypothetical protein [Butyricicoccus sp.]|uniref:hypothetical protein n=1 Tax=Butyricicoccus sp. TaxID=2049021 RepID=UPI003F160DBA
MGGMPKRQWIIVAAIVILVAVAFAGRKIWTASLPEHEPGLQLQEHTEEPAAEPEQESREMVIGEDLVSAIVQETLGDALPVSDLTVEITETGEICVTGNMQKSDIEKLLEAQDGSMSEAYQAVLQMFPDTLPAELKLRMQAEADKSIGINPIGILIGSLEIPDSMLPEDFYDQMEKGFQREVQKQVAAVDSVTIKDNTLVVSGT